MTPDGVICKSSIYMGVSFLFLFPETTMGTDDEDDEDDKKQHKSMFYDVFT